jgi:hypothetical protein
MIEKLVLMCFLDQCYAIIKIIYKYLLIMNLGITIYLVGAKRIGFGIKFWFSISLNI